MMITTENGQIEVYKNRIEELASTFIKDLDNPDDIREPSTFRLLLKDIGETLFKAESKQLHNKGTVLDLDDTETLDELWNVFTSLCYSCKITPTIGKFAMMVHVSPYTFSNWSVQRYRGNSDEHFKSLKKWQSECESAIEDNVLHKNSIGGIFVLKANYDWHESGTPAEEYISTSQQATPEQIMMKYQDAARPTLPQMED